MRVYDTRKSMGSAAADDVAACIRKLLSQKAEIWMIFAAAPSQNEFLEALAAEPDIEWDRIHALHMDEYIGLPEDAPQGFGNFLRAAIFSKVPFASVDYIGSGAVFGSSTKKNAKNLPLETLRDICASVSIPVVAIGGIGKENIRELAGCGIAGAAVVSAVFGAEDPGRAAEELLALSREIIRHA